MPVIRVSDKTWERLREWAVPLEDTADSTLAKVLDAAERRRAQAESPGPAPASAKPAKPSYSTRDLADHFGTSPERVRRVLRACGVRCGSGARHAWSWTKYTSLCRQLEDKGLKPAKPSAQPPIPVAPVRPRAKPGRKLSRRSDSM